MKRLILPIAPSVNHAYKNGRNGRRFQSSATKQYKHDAHWLAFEWRQKSGWKIPLPGNKIRLKYWVFWPDNRKRDADNQTKVILDSLTDILYTDDRYVLPQAMNYEIDKNNPRVEIELEIAEVSNQ